MTLSRQKLTILYIFTQCACYGHLNTLTPEFSIYRDEIIFLINLFMPNFSGCICVPLTVDDNP